MLSGLPLPDIRGTMGTFSYYGTDVSRYEEGDTEMGGLLRRLVFDGDVAQTDFVGPPNPIVGQQLRQARATTTPTDAVKTRIAALEARADVRLPMTIHWNRAGKSATIDIGSSSIRLAEHEWSKWIPLDFNVNLLVRIHGMAQFYLIAAGSDLQLYVSPVNWNPDNPPSPMSAPASFARDLYERLGPYRTLGWAEATWPLNEDRIDEKAFMDDLYRAFDDRAQVILQRLDSRQWDLLVGVIEATDRVQHMMWRLIDPSHPMYDKALAAKFGDAIERVYRRCDDFVGEVVSRVGPDTPILIVSDHGFHSFRQSVNLNTWLIQEGFMALRGERRTARSRRSVRRRHVLGERRLDAHPGVRHGAWTGVSQSPGPRRPRDRRARRFEGVQDDLAARLLTMTDPKTEARIIEAVYKRDDIYTGAFLANAAELQVGFAEGYRVSWQTTLGGSPPGIVYPNMKKWSGDHGSSDFKTTAGTLMSNRPIAGGEPSIMDIAPTVLKYFGLPIPQR